MTPNKPAETLQKAPRVFGYSLSFFANRPLRRILAAHGIAPRLGWPRARDRVLVWGRRATARRGQKVARMTGAGVVTGEDGFLRSVRTGRAGDAPLSLVLDHTGIYFETAQPNDLARMLANCPDLSEAEEVAARDGIAQLRWQHLSKYNDYDTTPPETLPAAFVLVVDQTYGDASIAGAGADASTFDAMLHAARSDHPDLPIVVKTHPETRSGQRPGYFKDVPDGVLLCDDAVSPWVLLERAKAVYCVSSQMGMEAIFAGHRPVVYGNAFFAGWGLTEDRHPATVTRRSLMAEQLFATVYGQYCHWYDPYFDRPTDVTATACTLAALARAHRAARRPKVFVGMRLWKRGFLRRFFGNRPQAPRFFDDATRAVAVAASSGADIYVWSGKETPALAQDCADAGVPLIRVEDGFLRSSGLGAQLIEPVSLAFDDLGIYYDPTRPNRLEALIADAADLPDAALARAEAIRRQMVALGLSKYNLKARAPLNLPQDRHLVLVPGQVEDDQSILKGTGDVATNLDLVKAARASYPQSFLVYKPHPDVVAGLRFGGQAPEAIAAVADQVVVDADITELLEQVDCVATMTSQTGFEALLRGKEVACYGAPFYAGWGLTRDFGAVPDRRTARPGLNGLIHAALVEYPRYWDPVTGKPCPIEVVLERFAKGEVRGDGRRSIRLLAKAQGLFASYAHLWR